MNSEEIEKIKRAGKIAQEVVAYAKEIVKKDMLLLEIADKVDAKIEELGAKPAFPINLSINEVAAHSTPAWNDQSIAHGLLKVDIGVHVDGYVADTAFSLDLENNEENKKLIAAAEEGLKAALEKTEVGTELMEIGKAVEEKIEENGFIPIHNLYGHQIKRYDLHAGLNIPNHNNGNSDKLKEGLYAIEPFSTNRLGRVKDGKPSGIYRIIGDGNVRDNFAREVLGFILEEYDALPFCSRWIYKKFGARGLLALKQIEQAGILHQYASLVEAGSGKVAQAEHSVLLFENQKVVTTKP